MYLLLKDWIQMCHLQIQLFHSSHLKTIGNYYAHAIYTANIISWTPDTHKLILIITLIAKWEVGILP